MQTNENRRESLPAPWLALGAGVAVAWPWAKRLISWSPASARGRASGVAVAAGE